MFAALWGAIRLAPAFIGSVWNLLLIALEIAKWVRSEYEKAERAAVVKKMKEAIKESRVSLDNSKLIDILSRKKNEPK